MTETKEAREKILKEIDNLEMWQKSERGEIIKLNEKKEWEICMDIYREMYKEAECLECGGKWLETGKTSTIILSPDRVHGGHKIGCSRFKGGRFKKTASSSYKIINV